MASRKFVGKFDAVLQGYGFTGCGKIRFANGLSEHDFTGR
jgi:hypothetical protein